MIFKLPSAKPAATIPDSTEVELLGRSVRIEVRHSARARSYRLSVPHHGAPVLTLPKAGRWPEAEKFLGRHLGWLEVRLKAAAPKTPFVDGQLIPLRGEPHRIHATGRLRGRVEAGEVEGEKVILVPGEAPHLARRLTDWLKSEAAIDLAARSDVHAATLGVEVKSVAMRSQATRWGSCSSTGRLNYNWRLILAPGFVLDYVAAHEVAHLVEMNHSVRFWRTVKRALPDMERGRDWLKQHGKELMGMGLE